MLVRRKLVKRHLGFTLIETVIVLGLLSGILLIGMHKFPSRQRQLAREKLFWEQLDTTWSQEVYLSSALKTVNFVKFNDKAKMVIFDRKNMKVPQGKTSVIVTIPETINITSASYIRVRISDKGIPSPMTIKFKSTLTGEEILLKIQFGWGAFHYVKRK